MMKRIVIFLAIFTYCINGQIIEIDQNSMDKWNIKTSTIPVSETIPLGNFISEISIPPQLLYSLTLPFRAQILEVNIANYQRVKKGEIIARATGQEWIEIQKQFIEDSIELKHHKRVAERKRHLCNEEIIPKKECHSADAEYKADMIKVEASKVLLKSYGATPTMIRELFNKLKISPSIPIKSKQGGVVIELNMRVGKSIEPSEALVIIKRNGDLWLEAELPVNRAKSLQDGEIVKLSFRDKTFHSKVLQHSPIIDNQNQTQKVKFLLPSSLKLLAGLRDTLHIEIKHRGLKVPKRAVISDGDKNILFRRIKSGFEALNIKIIAQDKNFYYIEDDSRLHSQIAISSVAILKSLMEGEDE